MSITRISTFERPSSAARRSAAASIAVDRSLTITRPPGDTCRAAARPVSAVPGSELEDGLAGLRRRGGRASSP